MKNTLRKGLGSALALIMAFIMTFGATPAFATEIGNKVLWDEGYDDENFYEEHRYGGKLAEGKNHLTPFLIEEGSYSYYYEFDADKSGYYLVSNIMYYGEFGDDGNLYDAHLPAEGGLEINGGLYDIVYFEKGTSILGLTFADCEKIYDNFDVEISYFDDEITDLIFDETIVENLLINEDITFSESDFIIHNTDYTVVFSNGKEIKVYDEFLCFTMKNDPVNGVNTVYATFAGFEKAAKATMYYIDYLVESIELENLEDYLVDYLWYDGTYTQPDFRGNITINYTDGTSETFKYGYDEKYGEKHCVTLFGNKDYPIHISGSQSVSGPYHGEFSVSIAEHTYIYEEYDNVVRGSTEGNKNYLLSSLDFYYTRFTRNVRNITEDLTNAESFEEVMYCIRRYIDNLDHIRDMIINIYDFIKFVI